MAVLVAGFPVPMMVDFTRREVVPGALARVVAADALERSLFVTGNVPALRQLRSRSREARIGLTNMGSTPVRARATEQALSGAAAEAGAVRAAAQKADEGTEPPADLNGKADYRRHLARVLTARAVSKAAGI